MIYILAVLFPCIALLLRGRLLLAIVLLILQLTVIGWIPAAIIACFVISNQQTDERPNDQNQKDEGFTLTDLMGFLCICAVGAAAYFYFKH